MSRLPRGTHRSRQSAKWRTYPVLMATVVLAACVHTPVSVQGPRRVSYWEALAELGPAEAAASARTESEKQFAGGLRSLMGGDFGNAEQLFGQLHRTATDSIIRTGSRVIYTA